MKRTCLLMTAIVGITLCCASTSWAQALSVTAPGSPYTPAAGLPPSVTVNFDEATWTVTGGTTPYTYAWDFGDGNTGSGATDSNAYSRAGTYTVTLIVTDNASATASDTTTASIKIIEADVNPPIAQTIGRNDGAFSSAMGTADKAGCAGCHSSYVDLHHAKYYTVPAGIPMETLPGSLSGGFLVCLTCHDDQSGGIQIYGECHNCHKINGGYTTSPHHVELVDNTRCEDCHSTIGIDGGPSPYNPSSVTPRRSGGGSGYVNNLASETPAGACNFCHDAGLSLTIDTNQETHHGTGVAQTLGQCNLCHDTANGPGGADDGAQLQNCAAVCHSRQSLHSIQADTNGSGVVVGGEDFGGGHVGIDNGPLESDCFGCHGGVIAAAIGGASGSDTITPTIYSADVTVIDSGVDTTIVVFGAALTNVTAQGEPIESDVVLTDADGNVLTLTPDSIDGSSLTVTIPVGLAAGNYMLRAVKEDVESDGLRIVVKPTVSIDSVVVEGPFLVITGSGFTENAIGPDSGTSCSATLTNGKGKKAVTETVVGDVASWTDTEIVIGNVLDDHKSSGTVAVQTVFGSATADLPSIKPGKGLGRDK